MLKYHSFTKSWYSRGTIAFQHLLWCLVTMVQTQPAPLPQFTKGKQKRKKKPISNNFEPGFCDLKSTYFSKIPPTPHLPQLIKNTSLGPVFRRNTSLTPPNAMRMDHQCKKACLIIHTHLENVEMLYTLIMEINISKSKCISTSKNMTRKHIVTHINEYQIK